MTREPDAVTVLDPVPFAMEGSALLEALDLDADSPFADDVCALVREAAAHAHPKGAYRLVPVAPGDDDSVLLDGRVFTSRILRINLEGRGRAFPFIATCGRELEEWSATLDDPLRAFWADTLKEAALRAAIEALGDHLAGVYQPGRRAVMNPGSLEDWPITEQPHLFALFGDTERLLGVRLTESYLMSPVKSVSGLWFETEHGFVNCRLCPRETCPNRRAPYDPGLYDRQYAPRKDEPA